MLKVIPDKPGSLEQITDEQLLEFAEKVASRFVKAGSIPEREKEDVKMTMVEKFLDKYPTILNAYKGEAKFTTYCIAILNRMCREIIRKEIKNWKQQPDDSLNEIEMNQPGDVTSQLIIDEEVKFLEWILIMFDDEYHKIKLFMAYYYQFSALLNDIENYDPNYKEHGLELYFSQTDLKNKGDIFANLALVVNLVENKKLKADAVRIWFNNSIDKIITRLNSPYNRANYDKDSLQILFEYFYLKKSESGFNGNKY